MPPPFSLRLTTWKIDMISGKPFLCDKHENHILLQETDNTRSILVLHCGTLANLLHNTAA